jgi:hypothetical protein
MAIKQEPHDEPGSKSVEDVQRKVQKGIRIVSGKNNIEKRPIIANWDTRVLDAEGRDITAELRVRKITITIETGNVVVATLECFPVEIDVTILEDRAKTHVAYPRLNKVEPPEPPPDQKYRHV